MFDLRPATVPFPRTPRAFLRQFIGRPDAAHPIIQFLKYGVAGGLATAVNIAAFAFFAWFVFPCVTEGDWVVTLFGLEPPHIEEAVRASRSAWCNAAAFVPANVFCYALNRAFVFKPGRLPAWLEFLSFCGVSALATVIGTSVMAWLIAAFAMQTSIAFCANLVTAVLFNYALRKFVIFKG